MELWCLQHNVSVHVQCNIIYIFKYLSESIHFVISYICFSFFKGIW